MKKNLTIIIILIVALVVIVLLTKNTNKPEPLPEQNSPITIEEELNTINVDAGIDQEMQLIDQELENL